MEARARDLVAIVGPTGSGKSELALSVASAFGGEIVGCDALQVYRELDLGTAKLRPEERRGVPHYLLDEIPPDQEFSAAEYVARAVPAIEGIAERGLLPVIVGGTGLYLRSLRCGLFEGPGRSPGVRERLGGIELRRGAGALHRILRRMDPASAQRIHPHDRVRLVRALEVLLESGTPMSELMARRRRPLAEFRDILIGLRPGRERLSERIAARVDAMYSRGLVAEVRGLRDRHGEGIAAFKAIGYREVLRLLSGEIDSGKARELTILATLQYAKRQMTWFRREPGVQWFEGCGDEPAVREQVLEFLGRELGSAAGRRSVQRFYAETGA